MNESDSAIEALDDPTLRDRLRIVAWSQDPLAVSDEQLFRMFRRARHAGNLRREGLFSEEFTRRLLVRGRFFALKAKLVPRLIDDLGQAAREIAAFIWERLLDESKSDAAQAEVGFGRLFEYRAIDFLRQLHPDQRAKELSIDELDNESEEGISLPAAEALEELQDHDSPETLAARKQMFERVHAKLVTILTRHEYEVFVLLEAGDWQVKEVAAALNVSLKTVYNSKQRALEKIEKEFKQ